MRLSAATLLLLECVLLTSISLNAQEDLGLDVDGHLRMAGSRPAQYSQGSLQSSTAAYVGLGTAAEATLGDAEQVANVLMADDASTAAALMVRTAAAFGGRSDVHAHNASLYCEALCSNAAASHFMHAFPTPLFHYGALQRLHCVDSLANQQCMW